MAFSTLNARDARFIILQRESNAKIVKNHESKFTRLGNATFVINVLVYTH